MSDDALGTVLGKNFIDSVPIRNGAEKVGIRKCRVKDLKLISNLLSEISTELGVTTEGGITTDLGDASVIIRLIATCADKVYDACAALCSLDKEQLEELDLDDGVAVVLKAYEVNKDFFTTKVFPLLGPYLSLSEPESNEPEKMQSVSA